MQSRLLFHFLVHGMVPALGTEFLELQPILLLLLVSCRGVVAMFAATTLQGNDVAHKIFARASTRLFSLPRMEDPQISTPLI
jgi:hypothetical protein